MLQKIIDSMSIPLQMEQSNSRYVLLYPHMAVFADTSGYRLLFPTLLRAMGGEQCFQDGWSCLDAGGPSRSSRTISRRPGRLIDPG